jgi:hypothetical protein
MKKYLFFASAIVLLISAFVALHSFNSVEAQTTGTGTFTIHAQICQTLANWQSPSGVTCSVTPRDPSAAEASQFSYDVEIGTSTVMTALSVDKSYSAPAGTYTIIFKGAPTNYLYVRKGGVFDSPYNFTVSAGQNTEVDIPYVIYQAVEQTAPVGVTITADIVDGNGNFVRALTTSEIQSVSFDIQHSVPRSGGSVGSVANNFDTQISSGKLNTSYSLATYVHTGSILTNIKPPSGFVVRSIEAGPFGTYFDPSVGNVVIHFTQSPAPSQVQKADQMLYVPNGISYVKKIAQTYSDSEYKYSNLNVDMFAVQNNNNRPFPLNWTVAKYSGVPYLFLNGMGKIIVYNISDPSNPKQVSEYILSALEEFNKNRNGIGQCGQINGTHNSMTSAGRIFALDDVPYLLVSIQRDGPGPSGTAIFSIDPSTMTMTAYPQWTHCNPDSIYIAGTAYGMYKGSDGNIYFVSQPLDDTESENPSASILKINSAGIVSQVAPLYKYGGYPYHGGGISFSGDASDIDYHFASVFHFGNKTYLIGPSTPSYVSPGVSASQFLYIYDISDPKNIIKINQGTIISTNGYGLNYRQIDEQAKRVYVQSSIPNPAATSTPYSPIPKTLSTWQVYDLSTLPNAPKLIATYTKATDLLDAAQVNADFAEIAKRLNITSSGNLVDISNYSFTGESSAYLVNVSNNLAYVLLSTNGKTPWDTIANQAGVTDGSEYGTNAIQFIVDITNTTQSKILGMIFGHTEYTPYAISADGWFDVPVYGSIFDYNGYIYRANFRIADVWKLGNPPAQSTGATNGGTGPSNPSISTTTIQNLQQTLFSFQNLLNIFKRIYAK